MSSKKEKYAIEKFSKVELEPLLPVIQNLTAQGYSLADIGMLLGYAGKDVKSWIYSLKNKNPEVQNAIEIGKNLADVELVKTAFKESTGYWIDEEEVEYRAVPNLKNITKTKWVKVRKKKKPKYIQPNASLLFRLLCSRLPEYFSDSKKIEINKTTMDIKDVTAKEIKEFAGKFIKIIDSEVIDVGGSSNG